MKASKRCRIFAFCFVGLVSLETWNVWAGDVVPSFTISKSHQSIGPNDLAWDIQPPVILNRLEVGESTAQFKIRSDERGLFVQIRQFRSSEQESLRQIEIVLSLDPDKPADYLRFVLEKAGELKKQYRGEEGGNEKAIPMTWRNVIQLEKDSQCHTVEIPFESLGRSTPQHGDVWGFNVKVKTQEADGQSASMVWVAPSSASDLPSTPPNPCFGTIAFE